MRVHAPGGEGRLSPADQWQVARPRRSGRIQFGTATPLLQGEAAATAACKASLAALGRPIDLMLVHWPGVARQDAAAPGNADARRQTWRVLERYHREGAFRAIGVSNYEASQGGSVGCRGLERALGKVPCALQLLQLLRELLALHPAPHLALPTPDLPCSPLKRGPPPPPPSPTEISHPLHCAHPHPHPRGMPPTHPANPCPPLATHPCAGAPPGGAAELR